MADDKATAQGALTAENTSKEQLSAFERWELPSLDAGEHVQASPFGKKQPATLDETPAEDVEDVQPLTAEECEALRQAAYEEGRAEGRKAGYDAGYQEGFNGGQAEVKAAATRLAQISRALLDPLQKQDDEIEAVILQLLETMVKQIIGRELRLDSENILAIVKQAIACMPPGAERIRIHLNPADADLVEKTFRENGDMEPSWRFLAHDTISPGGCIVDTETSVVDMRAEKRLATFIKQVYEKDQRVLEKTEQQDSSLDQLMGEVDCFQDAENSIDDGVDSTDGLNSDGSAS